MTVVTVKKATSIADLDDATRVRCSVFADELGYLSVESLPAGREVDGFDVLPTTINLVGRVNGETAATVRLLFANSTVAARCNVQHGLNIERYLKLTNLSSDMVLAEIPRSSVIKKYRGTGVMHYLYHAAYVECLRRGVTHWIAVGNTETDNAAHAGVVLQILKARGLWLEDYGASPKKAVLPGSTLHNLFSDDAIARVSAGDFSAVKLPRTLEVFAKVGARYFGHPFFDADFHMFAMPLLLRMEDFVASPFGVLPAAA